MNGRNILLVSGSIIILGFILYACSTAPAGNSSGSSNSSKSNSSSSSASSSSGGSSSSIVAPIVTAIYVATNGNDANSGTNVAGALRTVQAGVDKAVFYGCTNVYVAAGVYTPGAGLNSLTNGVHITNSYIQLLGGFSPGFTSRTGKSELNGTNGVYHIIMISNAQYVRIDGFILENGKSVGVGPNGLAGGLYMNNAGNCIISNTVISNNYGTGGWGGGVTLDGSSQNSIVAVIADNNVNGYGGGMFINNGSGNFIDCDFISNIGQQGAGGLFLNTGVNNVICGTFIGNNGGTGSYTGGGIYCYGNNNTISNAVIQGNSAGYGGGIYIDTGADNCMVYGGTIASNTAVSGNGGGIYCNSRGLVVTNTAILYNIAQARGGGIYFDSKSSNCTVIGGLITGDSAVTNFGGAIYLYCSTNVQVRDSVITNNVDPNAGIICLGSTGDIMVSNCMIGGSNSYNGCGIFEYYSDSTDQSLLNNIFLTNTITYLYHDINNGFISAGADWTNINVAGFTGAAAAGGNKVTNL